MPNTDLLSLLVGAGLGLAVSVAGLRIRRNWERFDADQLACRTDLIELARSAELARIAVRGARLREGVVLIGPASAESADVLLTHYASAAETVWEFSSRTRRLRPGQLRMASAGYALLLRSYHLGSDDPPTTDELDAAGTVLGALVSAAIDGNDQAHAALFALSGQRLCCPPSPYSSRLPLSQS